MSRLLSTPPSSVGTLEAVHLDRIDSSNVKFFYSPLSASLATMETNLKLRFEGMDDSLDLIALIPGLEGLGRVAWPVDSYNEAPPSLEAMDIETTTSKIDSLSLAFDNAILRPDFVRSLGNALPHLITLTRRTFPSLSFATTPSTLHHSLLLPALPRHCLESTRGYFILGCCRTREDGEERGRTKEVVEGNGWFDVERNDDFVFDSIPLTSRYRIISVFYLSASRERMSPKRKNRIVNLSTTRFLVLATSPLCMCPDEIFTT